MNMPPEAGEWIDEARRVHWVFRARRTPTQEEMRTAVAEYLRTHGEPAANKRIDVLMTLPPAD